MDLQLGRSISLLTRMLLVAMASALLLGCGRHRAEGDHSAPDILLLILDTTRMDIFGSYGSLGAVTPEIDSFASEAVRFERAYSHAPWTLPAVASLMTSRPPAQHGAGGVIGEFTALPGEEITLAECLQQAGYQTALISNVIFLTEKFGLAQGFAHVDADSPADNLTMRRAAATTDAALRWLDQRRRRPFFLVVHYYDPHLIYDPPQPFRARFADPQDAARGDLLFGKSEDLIAFRKGQRTLHYETVGRLAKLYMGEVAYMDQEVGRLLSGLSVRGMDEQMVVVITADHGEEFGDHGNFEHGHCFYEELMRVPLLVRLPASSPVARNEVAEVVRQIDIAPTLCDLAGVEIPASFMGNSLAPLMADSLAVARGARDRPVLMQGNMWTPGGVAWLRDGKKLILQTWDGAYQLYDLTLDPREKSDLAAEQPRRCRALIDELELVLQSMQGGATVTPQLEERDLEQLRSLGYVR